MAQVGMVLKDHLVPTLAATSSTGPGCWKPHPTWPYSARKSRVFFRTVLVFQDGVVNYGDIDSISGFLWNCFLDYIRTHLMTRSDAVNSFNCLEWIRIHHYLIQYKSICHLKRRWFGIYFQTTERNIEQGQV